MLTAPHIGNYGTNPFDSESERPYIEGLVTREFSLAPSNWRSAQAADAFLSSCRIPILTDIDTRALVRHIRTEGALRGVVSALGKDPDELVEKARSAPSMAGLDLATGVSTEQCYSWTEGPPNCLPSGLPVAQREDRFHVAAYDFGIKRNILRQLAGIGARVTVLPCATSAEDVLGLNPDGVFVSNGPGDPEPLGGPAAEIRKLVGRVPIFGICLGLQVLGQALGGKTYKLKFGHHGCNHPRAGQPNEQGRDHVPEPRVRARSGLARRLVDRIDAHEPQRRHGRGIPQQAGSTVLRPIPPRGGSRPARLELPVRRIPPADAGPRMTPKPDGFAD